MAENAEKVPVGSKEANLETLPSGVDDAGAIPKGQIDPVYEAKARVLNHAVSSISNFLLWYPKRMLTSCRFNRLAWAGINGSCS